ncbi:hypothetical protein NLJ89_g2208 [Agrocybe chaxingu]|uniref:Uncharacterized protein n=1 Tax=Agrocybe chaxingu TaxID=84603 RepID=A0A9W8MYT3_9AGAR|nr:hypothetical protein NLJ89_g2208 [Agrocybe chaxingu]
MPYSSDSDTSEKSKSTPSPIKNPKTPRKPQSKQTPASRGPKLVDVKLPGPSPKRVRRDSDESTKAPGSRKATHIRAASSVSSLKQVAQKVGGSPASAKKPESVSASVRKPKSKAKSFAGEDDFDDSVSVADSSISTTRVRRNEAERIQYFENQPECGKMEPHQVQCLRCNKPVNLGRKRTYTVRPWEIHRARCDQKPAQTSPVIPDAAKEDIQPAQVPESPAEVPSTSLVTPARRPTEEDRKESLESDKQIEKVEKHRVCCRKCHKWVDLSESIPYATGNWHKHKDRCSDAVPSHRVAAARRKLLVVNDPQAKSYDVRQIECGFCGKTIHLEGEGDFNLTKWDEHKLLCTKTVPISKSDSVNSIAFPSRFSRPPPSSASTDSTLVIEAGSSHAPQGIKRSREDDVIPEEDERPSARPRSASYLPPNQEAPNSVLGWFMLPFHSFVRGFKESLKDKS